MAQHTNQCIIKLNVKLSKHSTGCNRRQISSGFCFGVLQEAQDRLGAPGPNVSYSTYYSFDIASNCVICDIDMACKLSVSCDDASCSNFSFTV